MDKGPPKRARALRLESLLALVQHVRHDARARAGLTAREAQILAARDVSMLLIGWWGTLRADDLARLEWQHIEFHPEGLALHIPISKTSWAVLALTRRPDCLPLCPMLNLASVQRQSSGRVGDTPVFQKDERVFGFDSAGSCARRITTLFRRAGVPSGYTSHSLRAGFATEAAAQGVPDLLVQRHGRWLSASQHAEYVRDGRLWLDTPTSRISTPPTTPLALSGSEGR
jgi:integrase